ncbi:MAG: RsiV family protein [Bacteroidales bacterium]|nr:RsiV family protein [Bacteroidales bacterium]
MRTSIFCLLMLILSCNGNHNVKQTEDIDLYNENVGNTINYAQYSYDSIYTSWYDVDSIPFLKCFIKFPIVHDNPFFKKYIDSLVDDELISWVSIVDSKTSKNTKRTDILRKLEQVVKNLAKDTSSYFIGYELISNYNIFYPFEKFAIIHLSGYQYTGGVHGYYYDLYSTFFENKRIKNITSLISDTVALKQMLVSYLKKQSNIPMNKSLSDANFFVEGDNLPLTNNFFFTKDSFFVCYNPYEISSFADGIQRIGIPLMEVKKIMNKNIAEKMN